MLTLRFSGGKPLSPFSSMPLFALQVSYQSHNDSSSEALDTFDWTVRNGIKGESAYNKEKIKMVENISLENSFLSHCYNCKMLDVQYIYRYIFLTNGWKKHSHYKRLNEKNSLNKRERDSATKIWNFTTTKYV